MAELLRRLGCDGDYDADAGVGRRSTCPSGSATGPTTTWSGAMRASISVLGPLVARLRRRPTWPLPGGDAIGSRGARPARRRAGAAGRDGRTSSTASSSPRRRTGCAAPTIWLDFPSVGATENLLMAAVLAQGHHGHRQRRPRAGDRRHLPRCSTRWARGSTGAGTLDARRSRASTRSQPVEHTTSCPTASSPAPGRSPPR